MTNVLAELEIAPRQTVGLTGNQRSRLLNFLLGWEHLSDLHTCLDTLIPANPTLVSLLDLRAKALLAQDRPDDALEVMRERLELKTSLTPARSWPASTWPGAMWRPPTRSPAPSLSNKTIA